MYYQITAIILLRKDFRDDDLLIDVYSREKGKLILQAKGGKKIKSKLAGHLEPVTLSNLNVTVGKNIDQLIGAQIIEPFISIKNDIKKMAYASYFLELISSLIQESHFDQYIFNLISKALNFLNHESEIKNYEYKILRISFVYKLLHLLGFNPVQKLDIKLTEPINFIVKNTINDIIKNTNIIKNLSVLNKILDQELEIHLENELKTKHFLQSL